MATYVDNTVASPKLESLLSRRQNFNSSSEDSENGGEITTEDEMTQKREGFSFATDFPMRVFVYLFYVITFSWITALISPTNRAVYYLWYICRGICQTLSILLMMVVMVLRTYIEMRHYFKSDSSVNCSFLIINQLTSNDSQDYVLNRVYLWDVSYDLTALACLVYLVFYSYTTADDLSPHKIIVNTRKVRSSITRFKNYQFLRSSTRKRRMKECNTNTTDILIAFWQCILMLIVTTITMTVFYFYIVKVWNKECEKDYFCCISKILVAINSPQRYLSPVILCLLNRAVSVNLQTDIHLYSVQTFTNVITSPEAGWIKERYFEIISRINRYSDKFRTVIALNTFSALLGVSSLLIAHLFTAEDHLTQVWKSGAISMTIIYLTYFVLLSCTWMSVDGTAGYRRLIRRYSDDLTVSLYKNKNNRVDEDNRNELNVIAISANESQRSNFLIGLRFVILSGLIAIAVLTFLGIAGYSGWEGFQM